MSDRIDIEKFDANGDIRESAEAAGFDRSSFLKAGAVGGVGVAAMLGLPSLADAAISTKRKSLTNDLKIGNYALTLEYIEAAFYAAAVKQDKFQTPELKQFATVVAKHEAKHVAGLKKLLGGKAVKEPKFNATTVADLISPSKFAATAQALEDTGVAAYAGQGPNIKTRGIVVAALSIHSVEARHAAWIRFINGGGAPGAASKIQPAPKTYDKALSEKKVLATVKSLKVLK